MKREANPFARSVRRLIGLLVIAITSEGMAQAPIPAGVPAESRYGAHFGADGWLYFRVYSPMASAVNLLLYESAGDTVPSHEIPMQRHGSDWRIRLRGRSVGPGQGYMYRAAGPVDVSMEDQYGFMFNANYPLNDPYAYLTQNVNFSSFFSSTPFIDSTTPVYGGGGKSIVYDHTLDGPPSHVNLNREDLIVYEMHVQDYTARLQSLDAKLRGTYLGLAQSGLTTPGGLAAGIDHLVELGVNAVQLMPVME